MNIETQSVDVEKIFAPAREQFEELIATLSTADARNKSHSETERMLKADGFELLRKLFQASLDLDCLLEQPEAGVLGADGVLRTQKRPSQRDLESLFGTVTPGRIEYRKPGYESLHPLDAVLNLPADLFSFGVRRQVAQEAAKGSFDEALKELARTTGASVGKRQAEGLAAKAAQDFDTFYKFRAATLPVKDGIRSILVMTFDGKGIVVNKEDLRPATKKAAKKSKRKLKTRLAKGEKLNRKRMATVAAVYTIGQFRRTPEDVLDELRRRNKAEKRPKPYRKQVWASVTKEPEEVIRQGFEEALSRDPKREKTWVAVVDGNATQIKILRELAAEYGVELIIVLDLIHAIEYLWRAAHAFYADGSQEAEGWVTERLEGILYGRVSTVAGGIRRSATLRGLTGKKRKAVDACADYFLNHSDLMRYDEYLAAGLPLASGVIEGACRHLVKDRMDITGARWRLQSAEAILRLRALESSEDFEEYWAFHEKQEERRNNASLFALPSSPTESATPQALAS